MYEHIHPTHPKRLYAHNLSMYCQEANPAKTEYKE